ncbi:MAG TPA: GNAT family protein [Planctomycetota bacterium]|nr:GNAT family protein [Planctomycetota bacterium]
MDVRPVVLEGSHVRLEPLDLARHQRGLLAIGLEPSLWQFTVDKVHDAATMRDYLRRALDDQACGTALPFAIVDRASGRVCGSTRFLNIVREHLRVEVGATWLGVPFQRTARNTESKLLLLRHAFETWGCRRVELKTSRTNANSQAAMRRLGFVEEGMFRKWMVLADGSARDVVWYSVIDDEWPAMRARLQQMIAR